MGITESKDHFNSTVTIGDTIVWTRYKTSSLNKAVIASFTKSGNPRVFVTGRRWVGGLYFPGNTMEEVEFEQPVTGPFVLYNV